MHLHFQFSSPPSRLQPHAPIVKCRIHELCTKALLCTCSVRFFFNICATTNDTESKFLQLGCCQLSFQSWTIEVTEITISCTWALARCKGNTLPVGGLQCKHSVGAALEVNKCADAWKLPCHFGGSVVWSGGWPHRSSTGWPHGMAFVGSTIAAPSASGLLH